MKGLTILENDKKFKERRSQVWHLGFWVRAFGCLRPFTENRSKGGGTDPTLWGWSWRLINSVLVMLNLSSLREVQVEISNSLERKSGLRMKFMIYCCSVTVMSNFLWPHRLQHTRLSCPSLSLRVCSNSCPLSQWCYPTISSSVAPFSSCPQSFPESGS